MIDWKDVNKELPKERDRVLVHILFQGYGLQVCADYINEVFHLDLNINEDDLTHWGYINQPKDKDNESK